MSDEYFNEVSDFIDKLKDFNNKIKSGTTDDFSLTDYKNEYDRLYHDMLPAHYEDSFLYPPKAKELYGEDMGALLSGIYADMQGAIFYIVRGDDSYINLFEKLISEVHDIFLKDETNSRDIQKLIKRFWIENGKKLTASNVEDMVIGQEDDIYHRLCSKGSDFSDLTRLYKYGYYITDNEIKLAEYLASFPQENIDDMAATYVDGYIKGFEITGRDISKKRTVKCEYPIGFERVVCEAISQFAEKKGLITTFVAEPVFSYMSRGAAKRGVRASSINRRFDADHKDDKALYWDEEIAEIRLSDLVEVFEKNKKSALEHGGPAVIETFGENVFSPDPKTKNKEYSDVQNRLNVKYASRAGEITNRFIPQEERSFTIISYPIPEIGDNFEEIFSETVKINTLDYELYRNVQQYIIDALDEGEYVEVIGAKDNITNIKVMLHDLSDKSKETNFENCVADVNIPVGEVFTSPVLEGTCGTLFVSHVFLNGYEYRNLRLDFTDGKITAYSCTNYEDEALNKKFIKDNILFHHETLPIGEFAIGTNTTAYMMAKRYNIADVLPILIMEKTGPHFAVGDTCYSHAEDVPMYNPDGKECIARDNSLSIEKKYFNCHTDITIPFEELKRITVVDKSNNKTDIIRDGKFVLPHTEVLNEPLKGE